MSVRRQRLDALNVRVLGKGQNTIILCHGIGTDRTIWSDLIEFLVENGTYKVVVFDLACSPLADPAWYDRFQPLYRAVHGYVSDLLNIIDELQLSNIMYVGDDFSGMVGLAASTLRCHVFSKIFLINSSPRFYDGEGYHGGYERDRIMRLYGYMCNQFDEWLEIYAARCVGTHFTHLIERVKRYYRNMDREKLACVALVYMETDFRRMLQDVTTPCCIIYTTDTTHAPIAVPQYIRDHVRAPTSMRCITGGGDFPHFTMPGEIYSVIRQELLS